MDKCEYWKEPEQCVTGEPLVAYMRVACPSCEHLYKIKNLCAEHKRRAEGKIEQNNGMHCTVCKWQGHTRDFWTVFESKSV